MLVFFPTPYPDELLYSVCARYRKRTGDPSPKNLLQDLFGKNNVLASVDLPSHIGALVARLPVGSKITAERLVMEHTMYPFYSAFLPPKQAKSVLEAMVSGSGNSVYTRGGDGQFNTFRNIFSVLSPLFSGRFGSAWRIVLAPNASNSWLGCVRQTWNVA